MSSSAKNLSEFDRHSIGDASNLTVGIVVSEWNSEVTEALFTGATETLINLGVKQDRLFRYNVPGSFELPLAAQWLIENNKPDAVICIGCVIQGETRHFDFICSSVADGCMELGLKSGIPVIFGVLTPENQQQAIDRAGGKYGNKGIEAAQTAVRMALLKRKLIG